MLALPGAQHVSAPGTFTFRLATVSGVDWRPHDRAGGRNRIAYDYLVRPGGTLITSNSRRAEHAFLS